MNKIDRYYINYHTYGSDFPYEISEDGYWVKFDDVKELIKRDIPMELEVGLTCPKCNSRKILDDWYNTNNFCGNCGQRLKE